LGSQFGTLKLPFLINFKGSRRYFKKIKNSGMETAYSKVFLVITKNYPDSITYTIIEN